MGIIMQLISMIFSPYKTENLHLLNNSSFFPFPAEPGNHHSTF